MSYPIYIIFGILPAIVWLLFYLRRDVHPEPKKQVIKIFFYGALSTVPAILIELRLLLSPLEFLFFIPIIYWFTISLIEEVLKFLVVKWGILKNPEFDEPLDTMLYMIISALGFAALENILYLLRLKNVLYFPPFGFYEVFIISLVNFLRFIGAIFLHTLCSGVVGYFLALSFFEIKNRVKLIVKGLGIAISLHTLFNFSIIEIGHSLIEINGSVFIANPGLFVFFLLVLIATLAGSAIFVFQGFKKLKNLKSVCKIT